jgi:RNA polymerase sigma factor (sigma-70 family)
LIIVILRAPFSKTKPHEDLFLGHYAWLVKRAIQITQGRRDEADDLVQDLYIQLVHTRPDLDFGDDERVRGYLFNMMRNLSVSNARRAGRDALSNLLVIDYESAEFALASVDRSKLVQVRSALARVCEYTCSRMQTSRSASVLALRFFLGYYPSEIVRILQTTPVAVDKLLQAARLEARVFLERPGTLRFLGQEIPLTPISTALLPEDPIALFAKLRARIFVSVKGDCLSESVIQERYAQDGPGLDISELAHVASCASCLNLISHTLGMAGLSERHPLDKSDRQGGGGEPPASSGSGPDTAVLKKKDREIYEHAPTKLQFAVDGEIRVAHRIAAARNELQVKLDPLVIPAFLEVISEQGVRLVYLQVEESQLAELKPCMARAEFSNGRFVELKLSFVSGELIATALYYDPLKEDQLEASASPFLTPTSKEILVWSQSPQSAPARSASGLRRFIHACFPFLDSLWPLGIAGATAGILLLGMGLWIKRSTTPAPPTATALIQKAQQIEEAKMGGGAAIHSTFSLETRSQDGKVLATQTVDSWRSLQPHRSASRLLDSKGRIVAAEWKDAKGTTTRFPKRVQPPAGTTVNAEPAPNFDELWRAVAEGVASRSLATLSDKLEVHQESDGVDLHFNAADNAQASGLIKADWVLNAGSGLPVRGDLLVRENGSDREYRFRELTYDVVPASAVMDQDFTPDVSLRLSRAALIPGGGEPNIAHVVIAALKLVDQLTYEFGDLLDVNRTEDGKVEITGVLQSRGAVAVVKQEAGPLRASGQLSVNLHSRDETPAVIQKTSVVSMTSLPVTLDHAKIPMDAELRAVFTDMGLTGEELEARILKAAQDGISHGAQAQRAAFKLHQLVTADVSPAELRHISAVDRATWLDLLNRQAKAVRDELAQVSVSLSPSASNSDKAPSVTAPLGADLIASPEELGVATAELDTDCSRLSTLLTNNLAISASAVPQRTNTNELVELLSQSRLLGARISHTLAALSNNRQPAEQ